MPAFTPIPFPDLARRMRRELEVCDSIFDFPRRNWFLPAGDCDFSAKHFSRVAATPVGPAAGPHTQLAQNIVLSWLAGGRIIELKTVQVNDHLEIPRPSMHIPNVGYNVEWSQELTIPESLKEYAKAAYLIEILRNTRGFGAFSDVPQFESATNTAYDISVGYDLKGIQSDRMTRFLRSLLNPRAQFATLRRELTGDLRSFRDIELPAPITDCVTLSTFHGCPPAQVEAIARYLMAELGFNVIIKFNPTLLGFERVRELLIERMGYRHLTLRREAFEKDLQYADALEMIRRLREFAAGCGKSSGAKFTNTLVVGNNPDFFPTQTEPYMYLSGKPLHVIAMNLMQRFRDDLGFELPVSFSAGIDKKNFSAAVACGMAPVTTCTDLLRQGGYARLPQYLKALVEEMLRCGVTSREAYVLAARGHGAEAAAEAFRSCNGGEKVWNSEAIRLGAIAADDPDQLPRALRMIADAAGFDGEALALQATRIAGRRNGRDIVPALADDPRYQAQSNAQEPRRVARTLGLYDCINCDLCISACPNDAMFAYEAAATEAPTQLFRLGSRGILQRVPGRGFAIQKSRQMAVVADVCNACSNCEMYCPESGAPFELKERVFASVREFKRAPLRDGFCRKNGGMLVRLNGIQFAVKLEPRRNRARVQGKDFRLEFEWSSADVLSGCATNSSDIRFDSADFWRIKTVWESIFHSGRPNMVNPDPRRSRSAPSARTRSSARKQTQ